MTAAELDRAEKEVFLEWRREIASLEELGGGRVKVTPFEKNLEVRLLVGWWVWTGGMPGLRKPRSAAGRSRARFQTPPLLVSVL
jgi:hypothetical protein